MVYFMMTEGILPNCEEDRRNSTTYDKRRCAGGKIGMQLNVSLGGECRKLSIVDVVIP